MPAFISHLRRVSSDFKAKLPLRKQGTSIEPDEADGAGLRPAFPPRLARPALSEYGVGNPFHRTRSDSLNTPPLSPDSLPEYQAMDSPSISRVFHADRMFGQIDFDPISPTAPRRVAFALPDPLECSNPSEEPPPYSETEELSLQNSAHQHHCPDRGADERNHEPEVVAHASNPGAEESAEKSDLEKLISSLPAELMVNVACFLRPSTAASFAMCNRKTAQLVGAEYWSKLDRPENRREKIVFLEHLDNTLPNHLLCYECAKFHRRQNPGEECLRESYMRKPIIKCLRQVFVPTVRLSLDRSLPFPLAQLVMRRVQYGADFGIKPKALNRTWAPELSDWTTSTEWTHRTNFIVDKGELLMKVTSMHFVRANLTKSEQLLALTCRKDYSANYSTCAHEAHGINLFNTAKCALKHVATCDGPQIPSQCPICRPLKKCIACPTEYLIQVKLKEDKSSASRFHPAIIVSRWTNLGDCKTPQSREWRACSALQNSSDEDDFDVYIADDQRTVRRRFESASGDRPSEVRARPLRRFSSAGDSRERELMRDDRRRLGMFMRGY